MSEKNIPAEQTFVHVPQRVLDDANRYQLLKASAFHRTVNGYGGQVLQWTLTIPASEDEHDNLDAAVDEAERFYGEKPFYTASSPATTAAPVGPVLDLTDLSLKLIRSTYVEAFGPLPPELMANEIDSHICEIIKSAAGAEAKPCTACDPSVGFTCEEHGLPDAAESAAPGAGFAASLEKFTIPHISARGEVFVLLDDVPVIGAALEKFTIRHVSTRGDVFVLLSDVQLPPALGPITEPKTHEERVKFIRASGNQYLIDNVLAGRTSISAAVDALKRAVAPQNGGAA